MTRKDTIEVPYRLNNYVIKNKGSKTNIISFIKNMIVRAEQKARSDENPEERWIDDFELLMEREHRNGKLNERRNSDIIDNEFKVTRDKEIFVRETPEEEWEKVFNYSTSQ